MSGYYRTTTDFLSPGGRSSPLIQTKSSLLPSTSGSPPGNVAPLAGEVADLDLIGTSELIGRSNFAPAVGALEL